MGVAALYVLLYADFLAATQLLVYVGGILILILFGVMLTSQGYTLNFREATVNVVPAGLLSVAAAILLIYAFSTGGWVITEVDERTDTVYDLEDDAHDRLPAGLHCGRRAAAGSHHRSHC